MKAEIYCASLAILAVTLAAVGVAGAPASGESPTADGYCGQQSEFPGHTFVWTGTSSDDWNNPDNWSTDSVPGTVRTGVADDTVDVDYVCIGTNQDGTAATVQMSAGTAAGLAALDLGGAATLTMYPGSKLFANDRSVASEVRHGTTLSVVGSTLGGHGNVVVGGRLNWATTTGDPQYPAFSATQTTRMCDAAASCGAATTAPGRTTITSQGTMRVFGDALLPSGAETGGVNLSDGRVIENSGTISVDEAGYIAADDGTAIDNDKGGRFDIANDGGIFEGFSRYGNGLAKFVNKGRLAKTAGSGTAVIGIAFRPSGGTVEVDAGNLSIAGQSTPPADVQYGTSYGTAVVCARPTALCTTPTSTHSIITVRPNAHFAAHGRTPAKLTITQHSTKNASAATITVKAESSVADPNTITFVDAASRFGSTGTAQLKNEKKIKIEQQPSGGKLSVLLTCRSDGRPTKGQRSCVASITPPSSSGRPVRIVVRTSSVAPLSRWIVV